MKDKKKTKPVAKVPSYPVPHGAKPWTTKGKLQPAHQKKQNQKGR